MVQRHLCVFEILLLMCTHLCKVVAECFFMCVYRGWTCTCFTMRKWQTRLHTVPIGPCLQRSDVAALLRPKSASFEAWRPKSPLWLGKSFCHAQTAMHRCSGVEWVQMQRRVWCQWVCGPWNSLGRAVRQGCVVGLRAVGRGHAMVHAASTECVAHVGADLAALGWGGWKLPRFSWVKVFHLCWNFIFEVALFTVGTLDGRVTVWSLPLWSVKSSLYCSYHVLHELLSSSPVLPASYFFQSLIYIFYP